MSVDGDAALDRVVEPCEQLGDRRFPGTGVANECDRRPGRDIEIDPVEHLRPGAVAEADALEPDTAVDRGQLLRVGKVDDLLLLVHHVHDLVERRDCGQEGVVEL